MRPRRVDVIVPLNRITWMQKEGTMEPLLSAEVEELDDATDEELAIKSWQAEQLHRVGLPRTLAVAFAGCVDWHDVASLIARGCPPQLALEIAR
jgi:hypothetical protein